MSEASYPYKGTEGTCKYKASEGLVKATSSGTHVSGFGNSWGTKIMEAIDTMPVSVAIQANKLVFQTYSSGVITSSKCGTSIDHAVVATGYDNDATEPYFIVRNSWGASWGNAGYVNIGISTGAGICGINQYVYTVETAAA